MVLEGSFQLYNQFFESHEDDAPPGGWSWKDSYHYKTEQLQWFYDRGCKWRKIEAGPGDVILWDSRCIHYGAAAEGDVPRIATCQSLCFPSRVRLTGPIDVCYKPAKDSTPEMDELRKACVEQYDNTVRILSWKGCTYSSWSSSRTTR